MTNGDISSRCGLCYPERGVHDKETRPVIAAVILPIVSLLAVILVAQ